MMDAELVSRESLSLDTREHIYAIKSPLCKTWVLSLAKFLTSVSSLLTYSKYAPLVMQR